jgi:hypothetical protein
VSPRDVAEAEIRGTLAELVGVARTISEGVGPLTKVACRKIALEIEDALARVCKLIDQLP